MDRIPITTSNAYKTLMDLFGRSGFRGRPGASGVHLFHRGRGLNVLLDEFEIAEALWAEAPRQVSIALTNRCDLACSYCYAPKSSATLDLDVVARWLDELSANGCLGIGFGGGEPTLFRRFGELCQYATHQTGLAVTFTTHGHHITDTLAAELSGNVHFIRVSMDGVGATYEALRGRSFTELRGHLGKVRSIAPFGINFVVNSRTLPDLDNAVRFAADWGASQFLLLPEQAARGGRGIDQDTIAKLRSWVRTYESAVPLAVSEASSEGLPVCNPLANEIGLNAFAHIDASGVVKSNSFASEGITIGDSGLMAALEALRHLERK